MMCLEPVPGEPVGTGQAWWGEGDDGNNDISNWSSGPYKAQARLVSVAPRTITELLAELVTMVSPPPTTRPSWVNNIARAADLIFFVFAEEKSPNLPSPLSFFS